MAERTGHLLERLACLVTAAVIAGCASGPLVVDHLDELTGVTVTHVTQPVVLFRDRSAQAAFARDFIYLGPIEVNNMGRRNYYLWLGAWTTTDSPDRATDIGDFESIVIFADGEPLSLDVAGFTPESIGVSEPVYVKPVASALDAYFRVTADQIRVMAEANDLELRAGAVRPYRYSLWDGADAGTRGLQAFLREVE